MVFKIALKIALKNSTFKIALEITLTNAHQLLQTFYPLLEFDCECLLIQKWVPNTAKLPVLLTKSPE